MNSKYPDWVLKYKRKGTAVYKIGIYGITDAIKNPLFGSFLMIVLK